MLTVFKPNYSLMPSCLLDFSFFFVSFFPKYKNMNLCDFWMGTVWMFGAPFFTPAHLYPWAFATALRLCRRKGINTRLCPNTLHYHLFSPSYSGVSQLQFRIISLVGKCWITCSVSVFRFRADFRKMTWWSKPNKTLSWWMLRLCYWRAWDSS